MKTSNSNVISIGSDHAGFTRKIEIVQYLESKGYIIQDQGTFSDKSVDYPEFGHKVGQSIIYGKAAKGIVICGSGIGISIAANKIKGINWTFHQFSDKVRVKGIHGEVDGNDFNGTIDRLYKLTMSKYPL